MTPAPNIIQIVIQVNKDNDEITVSKCIDPQFDLDILTEGLASIICVNAKYTERAPERVLEDVHRKLKTAVTVHGNIKYSETPE